MSAEEQRDTNTHKQVRARRGWLRRNPRGWVIDRTDTEATLHFDLADEQDVTVCKLGLRYCVDDPLAIEIAVRAPSGAAVVERTMLRSDLRTAFIVPVMYSAIRVEPAGPPGLLAFRIWETGVALTVIAPAAPIVRFLAETDQLVDPIEREFEILNEQLAAVLGRARRARSDQ